MVPRIAPCGVVQHYQRASVSLESHGSPFEGRVIPSYCLCHRIFDIFPVYVYTGASRLPRRYCSRVRYDQ
jgi:hypothetical protein